MYKLNKLVRRSSPVELLLQTPQSTPKADLMRHRSSASINWWSVGPVIPITTEIATRTSDTTRGSSERVTGYFSEEWLCCLFIIMSTRNYNSVGLKHLYCVSNSDGMVLTPVLLQRYSHGPWSPLTSLLCQSSPCSESYFLSTHLIPILSPLSDFSSNAFLRLVPTSMLQMSGHFQSFSFILIRLLLSYSIISLLSIEISMWPFFIGLNILLNSLVSQIYNLLQFNFVNTHVSFPDWM